MLRWSAVINFESGTPLKKFDLSPIGGPVSVDGLIKTFSPLQILKGDCQDKWTTVSTFEARSGRFE
jgi:hypothetical protein